MAADTRNADDLVGLITGAASGIGRCVSLELAKRGARGLVLVDRDASGLETLQAELDRAGTRATTRAIDITDDGALAEAVESAAKDHGGLDLVHNNAGIMTGLPVYPAIDLAKVDEVIAINFRAVVSGIQFAHRALVAHGGGSILSTASGAGKTPFPPDPVYAATKAAVVSLTRSCAPAFARDGIRINAVCPSVVDTPLLAQNGNGVVPRELEEMKLLTPEEVAFAAVELMLDRDANGQTPSVFPS